MEDESYIKKLEHVIKQMLTPLKNLPFHLVIESLSGCKVESFDINDTKDETLLSNLIKAIKKAGQLVNQNGILSQRANEVGNYIEAYVKAALRTVGYQADIPSASSGSRKATGYPDLEFIDEFKRYNYIECKTFNVESLTTTFRSFYLSPSDDFKVTKDARHFAFSFEIFVDGTVDNKNKYKCKSWKIINLEKLSIDVKYEFNADNRRLYDKELIIAEGEFEN